MRRAMVTGINQTAIDISLHNARQLNCRFMELSAHSGARTGDGGPDYTNHSWWQGQIVSLDGEPGYLSLKDIGYGDVKGFGGANCRHNWHLFWPGISTPAYTPEALAEYNAPEIPWQGQLLTEEQARQKQRALERQIRRAKRECIVAEEWGVPSEESAAKARLARARARLNAYLEETGLKMDEGRTEVAHSRLSTVQQVNYSDNVTLSQRADIEAELSIIPEEQRKLAESQICSIRVVGENESSGYDSRTKEILLSTARPAGAAIHEYGHALERALDLAHNSEYISLRKSGLNLENLESLVYDDDTFMEGIWRFENDKFISIYQSRVYLHPEYGLLTRDGSKVNDALMLEYFSEGYRAYYLEPALLKAKDPALYRFIGGLTHDKK